MLSTSNALRATPPLLGTIRPTGLAPLTDPDTPTGQHDKRGHNGSRVNLPVPSDEENNPKLAGCTNRNA